MLIILNFSESAGCVRTSIEYMIGKAVKWLPYQVNMPYSQKHSIASAWVHMSNATWGDIIHRKMRDSTHSDVHSFIFLQSPPENLIYFHVGKSLRMKKCECVLKLQYNETNENVHLGFTVGPGCICFHQQHIISYILAKWVRATGFTRDLMNPLYIHLHLIMCHQ